MSYKKHPKLDFANIPPSSERGIKILLDSAPTIEYFPCVLNSEILAQAIKSTILSAYVKRDDTQPVSILIVAPVECGKTSLALENCGDKAMIMSDLSGMGLLEALFQNKEVTHLVVNDLMVVAAHKSSVSRLTISILNGLSEEGSYNIALPRMTHLSLGGRKVGVIACCTPELIKDNRSWWKRSGFSTRLLNITFSHSVFLRMKIMSSIEKNNGKEDKEKSSAFAVPETHIYVDIPSREASKIRELSEEVAKYYQEQGYRRQKQLRSMACGHALISSWKKPVVGQKQIEFLLQLMPFVKGQKEI